MDAARHIVEEQENGETTVDSSSQSDSRDWDPYKVWQNHIKEAGPDQIKPSQSPATDGWHPYKVWESLFKR